MNNAGNGLKHMVKYSDLKQAPVVQKKSYIFESSTSKNTRGKNEWQIEKERRRARAQKKAQRVKSLEDAKEGEKKKWQNFNVKAMNKGMKVCLYALCRFFSSYCLPYDSGLGERERGG